MICANKSFKNMEMVQRSIKSDKPGIKWTLTEVDILPDKNSLPKPEEKSK